MKIEYARNKYPGLKNTIANPESQSSNWRKEEKPFGA